MSVCLGIGLAAACGFRVFVPLLTMGLAMRVGWLDLSSGFDWIGSLPALIVFAVATLLEIGAYYIPWLDHFLDTVASPAAVVAGIIAAGSVITGIDPMLKWTLAVIAGGGAAGAVQGLTGVTRIASTMTTGGIGNPVVATGEAAGSTLMSLLAIIVPFIAATLVAVILIGGGGFLIRRRGRRRLAAGTP